MSQKPNTWNKSQESIKKKGKFAKKGMITIILPTEPYKESVEGKYGKRDMYVVESKEYGKLYVNDFQFLHICDVFAGNFSTPITVEF